MRINNEPMRDSKILIEIKRDRCNEKEERKMSE